MIKIIAFIKKLKLNKLEEKRLLINNFFFNIKNENFVKIFFISIIITAFGIFYAMSKATDSIVGSVEGMMCIECQKKLIKVFQDELGKEHDIKVIVSWEDGLGS